MIGCCCIGEGRRSSGKWRSCCGRGREAGEPGALNKGLVWIAAGIALLPVLFDIQCIWLAVPIAEFITVMLSVSLMYRHLRCL